jgi:hypothetical protein
MKIATTLLVKQKRASKKVKVSSCAVSFRLIRESTLDLHHSACATFASSCFSKPEEKLQVSLSLEVCRKVCNEDGMAVGGVRGIRKEIKSLPLARSLECSKIWVDKGNLQIAAILPTSSTKGGFHRAEIIWNKWVHPLCRREEEVSSCVRDEVKLLIKLRENVY